MPDDISIPHAGLPQGSGAAPISTSYTHSYRARRTGMDTSTRRLVMAASALGLVLLAGMGVWTFSGHRPAGVPVIEADTRPLRVKPENPGGMTVVGANEQVMNHGDGDGDTGDLAPEPERPDPQALRAQRQVTPPAAAPSPAATAPATTATATAGSPAAAPAAPAPSTPAPAPVAEAPARPAPAATGNVAVQIAAVDAEGAAAGEWQRLQHKAPELLGDRKSFVTRTERDGKTFWRIRTGGFADMAAAAEFCRKLRAKGVGCSIGS